MNSSLNNPDATHVHTGVRNRIKAVVALMVVVFVSGCGHRTRLIRQENEVYVEGLVSVWGTWVKDKDKKLDLRLNIENAAPVAILIPTRGIKCSKGERWGELELLGRFRHSRRLLLHPGETRKLVMVCHLARGGIEGELRILFQHIFEDPLQRADGVAQLMATDVEWVVPQDAMR